MIDKLLENYLNERPIPVDKVHDLIVDTAILSKDEDFDSINGLSNLHSLFDEIIAIPALASLIAWRTRGIRELQNKIKKHDFYGADAFYILILIASKRDLKTDFVYNLPENWFKKIKVIVDAELQSEAEKILKELVLDLNSNENVRDSMINNLSMILSFRRDNDIKKAIADYFFSILIDSRLQINLDLIMDFEEFLNNPETSEERIQTFLFDNPILLDPLAIEIYSKHELGNEFKTDFVIKRLNNDYVLVEIEKSTDKIFTNKGVFHSQATEAIAQVRDFQSWIHENLSYARNTLPSIRRPEALLIIGRRKELTQDMQRRLDEENYSRRGHIKIITYDDLLDQARTVYDNLINKPIRIKGKKLIE